MLKESGMEKLEWRTPSALSGVGRPMEMGRLLGGCRRLRAGWLWNGTEGRN